MDLFYGTNIPENFYNPIRRDITDTITRYNTLRPMNQVRGNLHILELQGYLNIPCNGRNVPVSLTFQLINFPTNAPICFVSMQSGQIQPNEVIRSDGLFDVNKIYRWIPLKGTIYQVVTAVFQYFTQHPPGSNQIRPGFGQQQYGYYQNGYQQPSSQPQQPVQQISTELFNDTFEFAQMKFIEAQSHIENEVNLRTEYTLTQHQISVMNEISNNLERQILPLRQQYGSLNDPKEQGPKVDPQIANAATIDSQQLAYIDTINFLKDELKEHRISIQDFVKVTRSIGSTYFEQSVFPQLS